MREPEATAASLNESWIELGGFGAISPRAGEDSSSVGCACALAGASATMAIAAEVAAIARLTNQPGAAADGLGS